MGGKATSRDGAKNPSAEPMVGSIATPRTGQPARGVASKPRAFVKRHWRIITVLLCIALLGLLGLIALRNRGGQVSCGPDRCPENHEPSAITDDTYFYGLSSPYYPSPTAPRGAAWSEAYKKADALIRNMTIDEKVGLTTGTFAPTSCSGNIAPIPRLGFPGLCLSDAGNGLRGTDFVSGWPSGIHVGASWNRRLARQRAASMGQEFRIKGVNVALGPVVGPLGRVVLGGRIWEGFSIDPCLSGALAADTVQGIQSVGVIASTKHFIGNEQETNRVPALDQDAVSSNIDDKTMHELYLWPFQDAVRAGTGSVMCSYNRINNSFACQNSLAQNNFLKEELGFEGFIVSDWSAQQSGVASALAGLDMAMPSSEFWGAKLVEAVKNGSVAEARLDDMATRIVASFYQMRQEEGFPSPGVGMPPDLTKPHDIVDARNVSSRQVLFDGAVEGHVLVKNIRNALPLKKPKMLSLYGYSARNPDQWNYNAVLGVSAWGLGGESAYLARDTIKAFALQRVSNPSQIAPNGTIISGGGSGAVTPAHISSPFDGISSRAYDDHTALFWDLTNPEPHVDAASDACIVLVNAFASEGYDRPGTHDDYSDGLIKHVANSCNNTIVVIHNAGVRLVDQFIDHPNVTGVLFGHLPGQESGRALVSIVYGESNPSGKLPYTVARNESDYGEMLNPAMPEGRFTKFPQSNFSEGVFVDYRRFDARGIRPRYEFGFGLSYTTFEYSSLKIETNGSADVSSRYTTRETVEGGPLDLWDTLVTVRASVRNTGARDGADVAQMYVGGAEGAPVRQLRGFDKPFIRAGETATVTFELNRRDLSVWDVVAQKWRLEKGTRQIWVGPSSRSLPLHGNFTL